MVGTIQEGIHYNTPTGNSFCLIFLKISKPIHASDLSIELSELWKIYMDLKIGKINDLDIHTDQYYSGNLSVLLGYGPKIFDGIVSGIKKKKPIDLVNEKGFRGPNISGGQPIASGSGINFSKDIVKNHAVEDHIIIQFIANAEMFTNRAIVETWKHINKRQKPILDISTFYSGFQRVDHRGWLGFHESISNIPIEEREKIIAINNSVSDQDNWLINGTYMAYINFIVDLQKWEKLSISEQEIVIGRKKTTGCPVIGLDKNGNPINDPDCPVPGTNEVLEYGNEKFREFRPIEKKMSHDFNKYKSLSKSHIHRVRKLNDNTNTNFSSLRIFRQGFEFLKPFEKYPGFQAGLNFISFQNKPQTIMKMLTLPHWLGRSVETNYYGKISGLEAFISARTAGIFIVPPFSESESFPGSIMFS